MPLLSKPATFAPLPFLLWRILSILFILYCVFVLYPSYASGLATFDGDPKWDWEGPIGVPYLEGSFGFFFFVPAILTYLFARSSLIPLALLLLLRCVYKPRMLVLRERWLYLGTSIIIIGVVVGTWQAGPPFFRWLAD